MTNREKFLLCFNAAQELAERYKLEHEFLNFDFGGGESEGSSSFARRGTTQVAKEFTLPSDLAALVSQAYTGSQVAPSTVSAEKALLEALLGQSSTSVPGLANLQAIQGIDATNFGGRSTLETISNRNPYSTDYENAIGSLYDRMFAKGRSLAMSGPTNVRGGTARQGFELAELDSAIGRNKFKDVREQQDREVGAVSQAVQLMNTIESMRRGSQMQAQQQQAAGEHSRKMQSLGAADGVNSIRRSNQGNIALASDLLGKPKQTTTENINGKGNQATQQSNWGVGITCCFIFLEALNGQLPEYVRRGRDEFNTVNRRRGYVWMSSWLVPWMRRSKLVRKLVNLLMVKPFLKTGERYYLQVEGSRRSPRGPVALMCWGWFHLWSFIGVIYGKLLRAA